MGSVIFLHGASSSGETTLARHVQAVADRPFWHLSIDHLRDSGVWPMARFRSGDLDWRAARPAFIAGFHRSVAACVAAGNDVILEHILDRPEWLDDLRALLAGRDVFLVGVHCDLPVLTAREAARGDRPAGSAAADFATVHRGLVYDLDVRSEDGVETNAARILDGWRSGQRRSVFAPQRGAG